MLVTTDPALLPRSPAGRLIGRIDFARVTDVAVMAVSAFAMTGMAGLGLEYVSESDASFSIDFFSAYPCWQALWWRRRWPVHISVAAAVMSVFSLTAVVVVIVGLFTLTLRGSLRPVLAVTGLFFGSSLVFPLIRPIIGIPVALWLLYLVLATIVTILIGLLVRLRREHVLSAVQRARRAETAYQEGMDHARQLERKRIAREMHDTLAHRLSLVSMHAGALEFRSATFGEEVAQAATVIQTSAHQALDDLRSAIHVLRSDGQETGPDGPQPVLDDLPHLIQESWQAGTPIDLRLLTLQPVPLATGRIGYRVLQEGLTNARKHAPGNRVTASLSGDPETGLSIEVLNQVPAEPRAAPAVPGARQGLTGLTERVTLAGGRLRHGTTHDGCFRLQVWLPWTP